MSNAKDIKKLQALVDLANKDIGPETLMLPELGMSLVNEKPEVISTGLPELDTALGIGGFPKGRIVEIMGQEASGKTTLVLHTIASAQQQGIRCAFIDTEHAIDRYRAEFIGVKFEELLFSQPNDAEQALELIDFLIDSKQVGVIVLDSVAALVPKAELEGDMTDANMGVTARLMGKTMRKITGKANKGKVLVMFTNQIRNKIGGFGFGPQETTSGGNALKFYASIRIDMRKTTNNKKGDTLVSTNHKITVKKNKLSAPMVTVLAQINKSGFVIPE